MCHGYIDDSPGSWEWQQFYKQADATEKKKMNAELKRYRRYTKKWNKMFEQRYKNKSTLYIECDLILRGEGCPGQVAGILKDVFANGDAAVAKHQGIDDSLCRG